MRPWPCFFMASATALEQRNGPVRFMLMISSQMSRVILSSSANGIQRFMAALLTRTSMESNSASVRSTMESIPSGVLRSAAMGTTVGPSSRSSAATASAFSWDSL